MIDDAEGNTWVTLDEAMLIVARGKSTIYRWVGQGKVRTRRTATSVMEFHGRDVRDADTHMRRGRPKGTARPAILDRRERA